MANDEKPPWDDQQARQLVGRHILIGVTKKSADGKVIEQQQMHGLIDQVDERKGIGVRLAGSAEMYWMPPHLEAIRVAPPGEYRLRATGEVVVNPDLMATWTVTSPVLH